MQRRTLLKLGLVSGTVLALAGGAAMLMQPGLVQRRLTDAGRALFIGVGRAILQGTLPQDAAAQDRKSTRLNSSHSDRSRMPSSA